MTYTKVAWLARLARALLQSRFSFAFPGGKVVQLGTQP